MEISHLQKISREGFSVVRGAFDSNQINIFRNTVLENIDQMPNTRPNLSSRHVAGFHRFSPFKYAHESLCTNQNIQLALGNIFENADHYPIGLSDITVNRSQPWHNDLLRGKYSEYLDTNSCWADKQKSCYKVLVYLQNGKNLQIVPGSHLLGRKIEDSEAERIASEETPTRVAVKSGDAIIMDVRLIHRGSSQKEVENTEKGSSKKILISTVFGQTGTEMARKLEQGNSVRMTDWDKKWLKTLKL